LHFFCNLIVQSFSACFYKIKCAKTSLKCRADFYNWNRVKLRYCDGGSFMGDSIYTNSVCLLFGCNCIYETMFALWSTSLPFGICPFLQSTVLYFSGQRIWDAIITDLLGKGLARAEKVPHRFSLQPVMPVSPWHLQHKHQFLRLIN